MRQRWWARTCVKDDGHTHKMGTHMRMPIGFELDCACHHWTWLIHHWTWLRVSSLRVSSSEYIIHIYITYIFTLHVSSKSLNCRSHPRIIALWPYTCQYVYACHVCVCVTYMIYTYIHLIYIYMYIHVYTCIYDRFIYHICYIHTHDTLCACIYMFMHICKICWFIIDVRYTHTFI